uniref:tRNA N(3)-methylcytidine methyltransferase n=1 Tax=Panagrolaimus sp. JU765 TaxID=591449 RepID=A0AC34QWF3_9BILA
MDNLVPSSELSSKKPIPSEEGVKVDESEIERLSNQPCLTEPWVKKLEFEAQKNWDKFYKRNNDKFFKDRHWGKEEIISICKDINFDKKLNYLEAGCGVGNMLFPMMDWFKHWNFYGFDFSKNAIQILQERAKEENVPVQTDVVDLTNMETPPFNGELMDLATLIFVLSAISPEKHGLAVQNLGKLIKTGGTVVFRDYAAYDHAMMRFKKENKISERFYKRADWTRAYYFFKEEIEQLFTSAGFEIVNCLYYHSITENKQTNLKVNRVFLQAIFKKI